MLTTDGKLHVKRYLAQFVPTIAESIAFGLGTTAEAVGDTRLSFELSRVNVDLTSYDFTNNKLIFKATIPVDFSGTVNEIGVFSQPENTLAGTSASRIITTFDSSTEDWVDAVSGADETAFDAAVARAGDDGLLHTPPVSTTKSSALRGIMLDFSGNSNADNLNFAYNVGNTNTSNIKFRFLTDASNYYDFAMGAQTVGYKIVPMAKSTATVTGAPDWNNISELQVLTTSSASGSSAVVLDAIRIEDVDTVNPDYVLVARKVLSSSFVFQKGTTQDIEFALDVSI